jgi:hypothetical protein
MGRPFKPTHHQKREAIKRRDQGDTLAELARSYNVSQATNDFEADPHTETVILNERYARAFPIS